MKKSSFKIFLMAFMTIFMFACDDTITRPDAVADVPATDTDTDTPAANDTLQPQAIVTSAPTAKSGAQILGNSDYLAISYGAWRSTTRAAGADVPTVDQQKEDMKILAAMGIKVLRTYNTQGYIGLDGKSNTENLLIAIDELMTEDPNFEMYVMLGVWIDALNSWTDLDVIHDQENPENAEEMAAAIQLAKDYPEIIKVIAVGNEAMVHWAPYHVAPAIILNHVNALQALKASGDINENIWITSSDNHAVWAGQGDYASDDLDALIAAVDYISLHTYPFHDTHYDDSFWKVPNDEADLSVQAQADAAMIRAKEQALEQFKTGQDHMLTLGINKPIHIGETGWSSETNVLYGEGGSGAADEYKQKAFYDAMRAWSNEFGASLFFFEALDEPWKGDNTNPSDSEQHFGLINIDCEVKYLLWDLVDAGAFDGLDRNCGVDGFTKTEGGNTQAITDSILQIPLAPVIEAPLDGEFIVLSTALYEGATAYGWDSPANAWAGVNTDTGVLTVATDPLIASDWGWGAGVGGTTENLSEQTQITFEIRGVTSAESVFPAFEFYVAFETATGGLHNVRFNTGGYVLTEEFVEYTIPLSDFSAFDSAQLNEVTSPFTIYDIYAESGGSAPTTSSIEIRNISYQP
ncbi:hypothetical protein [Psychromonas sp.]|uniref:hypothetical protein n=1 Tax=Psychromonas sp. TaxID=1884585 RepID=UPI0039E55317